MNYVGQYMEWQKKKRKHTNEVEWHGGQRSDVVGTLGEATGMSHRQYLKTIAERFTIVLKKNTYRFKPKKS